MVSYAFRRGCTDIILVYPNSSEYLQPPDKFEVVSGFEGKKKVNITAMEIPFWSMNNFEQLNARLKEAITLNLDRL